MNYPDDFMRAEHLTGEAKAKLMAVYNTVRCKDVIGQAFEMLCLHECNSGPYDYYSFIKSIIAACSLSSSFNKVLDEEYGMKTALGLMDNLMTFFEILASDDFRTILAIDKVSQYEGDVDKLYDETKIFYLDKAKALELPK